MKRKLMLIILLLCIFPSFVNASYYCKVQDGRSQVRIRKNINSEDAYAFVKGGATFDMPDNVVAGSNNACSAWYKVYYNGNVGYICGTYIDIYEKNDTPVIEVDQDSKNDAELAKNDCQGYLNKLGFPSNYSNLCSLKVKYPNWTFVAVNTGLDYADAVEKESKCGKNTIADSAGSEYIDTSCTSSLDKGSAHASSKAIAYYLNPLNFLKENTIFMFEDQNTNKNIDQNLYLNASSKTFAKKTTEAIPYMLELVYNASNDSGLSQMAISARFKQELGNGFGETNMYCIIAGNYTAKYGWYYGANASPKWKQNDSTNRISVDNYYNWFNIGANDGSNVTQKSYAFAINNNWGGTGDQKTDRQLAMTGGAKWIVNNYLNAGQNTVYFNKFNTHPSKTSNLYAHQYMSNVKAPESESIIAYNAYNSAGILNSKFKFYIPVYSNLGAVINNSPDGATGEDINNNSGGIEPSTIVVSSGLKLNGNQITGIKPGTTMEDLKNKFQALGGSISGDTSGLAGTGRKLTVSNGSKSTEFVIIIKGDTSGDGVINALDLLQVQKKILGLYSMNTESSLAGDTSGDGVINALDLLQVQKSILGQFEIKQ